MILFFGLVVERPNRRVAKLEPKMWAKAPAHHSVHVVSPVELRFFTIMHLLSTSEVREEDVGFFVESQVLHMDKGTTIVCAIYISKHHS